MLHHILLVLILCPFEELNQVSQGHFFLDFGLIPTERIDEPSLSIQRPLQTVEPTMSTARTLRQPPTRPKYLFPEFERLPPGGRSNFPEVFWTELSRLVFEGFGFLSHRIRFESDRLDLGYDASASEERGELLVVFLVFVSEDRVRFR